jgi:hypothetical protein
LAVPDDLAKAEVGNLDKADATGTLALDELALVGLVFVVGALGLRVSGWDEWRRVEQEVLGLDVTVR